MNKIKEIGITAVIATLAVVVVLYVLGYIGVKPLGGATTTDLIGIVGTSSQNTITNAVTQLRATSTCSSTIITTGAVAIGLNFNRALDSANMGLYQAASTTVNYDAALYGCGTLKVRSAGASTIVNFVEMY